MIFRRLSSSKSAKNALWSVLEVSVFPTFLIVFTPFYIEKLGFEKYGIWVLATSIIHSFYVVNFGFNEASIKFIAAFNASSSHKLQRFVSLGFLAMLVSLILCTTLALVAYLIPSNVYNTSISENYKLLFSVLPITLVITGLKSLEQFLNSIFKGFEKFDLSSKTSLSLKIGTILSGGMVLHLGFGLFEIMVAQLLITVIIIPIQLILLHKNTSILSILPKFDREIYYHVKSFAKWTWIQNSAMTISLQFDKYLVAGLIDLKTLTFYSLGLMIFNQTHMITSAAANWILPVVSKKVELKENNLFELYNGSKTGLLIINTIGLVLLIFAAPIIFPLWLGNELYESSQSFIFSFITLESIMCLTIIPFFYLTGYGEVKLNTYLQFGNKTLNVIFILLFFYFFNAQGVIIGLIISATIYVPILNWKTGSRLFDINDIKLTSNLKVLIPPVFIGLMAFSPLWYIQIIEFLGLLISIILVYKKELKFLKAYLTDSFIEK